MFQMFILSFLVFRESRFKTRNRLCLTETITNVNYADDLLILANTPAPAKSLFAQLAGAIEYTDYTSAEG